MIHIRSMEQNDALVAVLEDARGAERIDVSETARHSLYVTELNRTGKVTRITYVQTDGETEEVEP